MGNLFLVALFLLISIPKCCGVQYRDEVVSKVPVRLYFIVIFILYPVEKAMWVLLGAVLLLGVVAKVANSEFVIRV